MDASVRMRDLEYMRDVQHKSGKEKELRRTTSEVRNLWRGKESRLLERSLSASRDPAVKLSTKDTKVREEGSQKVLMVYPGWYVLRSNVLSLQAIDKILTFVEGEEGGAPFVKRMKRTCLAAPCTPPPHAGKEATLQNLRGWDRARVALIAAWIKNEKRGRKRPQTIVKACNAFKVGQFHEPLCSL